MRTDELEPEPPPRTGFQRSPYWRATSALSLSSSTSFVCTVLAPGPESLRPVRSIALVLFIAGLLTGIFSAILLMMSGFVAAGTARVGGRRIAGDDLAYGCLVCDLAPVLVVAGSVFQGQVVY